MNYFRMISRVGLLSLGMCVWGGMAYAATDSSAATKEPSKAAASKSKTNPNALVGQSDIVGNKDLPMVTNIVLWQEKEGSIPKDMLEFSALKDSLTPTDRDRLAGEIRYTSILNQPTTR